jgi:integrase
MTMRRELDDKSIRAVRATDKRTQLTDGAGLYLKLQWGPDGQPSGRGHQWRLDYTRPAGAVNGKGEPAGGKRNTLSLGAYPTVSLAQAREAAEAVRVQVAQGIDPGSAKTAVAAAQEAAERAADEARTRAAQGLAKAGTLQGVAQDLHAHKLGNGDWTAQNAAQWLGMLTRYAFPVIGTMAIAAVTPKDILACVQPLEKAGMIPSSRCVRKFLSQVFRYAMVLQLCPGDPAYAIRDVVKQRVTAGHNPAATNPVELTRVLRAILAWPTVVTRAALQVQAALFQRPGDTRSMRWADVDLDAGVWVITPEDHTKIANSLGGAPHTVPLPRQIVDLLRSLHPLTGGSEWVFESPMKPAHPITNDTLTNALRNMGLGAVQTAHGFRATARTMLPEQLGAQAQHVEMQLAHSNGMQTTDGRMLHDPLGKAYNRATWVAERRVMLQQWADYLDSLVTVQAIAGEPLKLAA